MDIDHMIVLIDNKEEIELDQRKNSFVIYKYFKDKNLKLNVREKEYVDPKY